MNKTQAEEYVKALPDHVILQLVKDSEKNTIQEPSALLSSKVPYILVAFLMNDCAGESVLKQHEDGVTVEKLFGVESLALLRLIARAFSIKIEKVNTEIEATTLQQTIKLHFNKNKCSNDNCSAGRGCEVHCSRNKDFVHFPDWKTAILEGNRVDVDSSCGISGTIYLGDANIQWG